MKILFVFLALLLALFPTYGQKLKSSELPVAVKDAFHKAYPAVTTVKWEKEKNDYEASFDDNKVESSVVLNGAGMILETEIEINKGQLPKEVKEYVDTHYKGKTIKEAARITDANGVVTFEAALKGIELLFTSKGEFIKEVKD